MELIAGQPQPKQAAHFASLAQMASDDLFTTLFGARASTVLEALFLETRNDFSHSHTSFLLADDADRAIAGMLHAYPAQAARANSRRTLWLLLRFARFQAPRLLAMAFLLRDILDFLGENLQRDDFYISMLAIYPQFRGAGLSKALLTQAHQLAASNYCARLVLDVDQGNTVARAAYAAAGFLQIDASNEVRLGGDSIKLLRLAKPIKRAV